MSRPKGRKRQTRTDVSKLWDLPKIDAGQPVPPQIQDSTGPLVVPAEVNVTELRELVSKLQVAVTEGHGLLKDFRVETRRAQGMIPMLVSKRISAEVTKQLEVLGKEVADEMHKCMEQVDKEFARVTNIYLGKDPSMRKAGSPALEDLVHVLAEQEGRTSE